MSRDDRCSFWNCDRFLIEVMFGAIVVLFGISIETTKINQNHENYDRPTVEIELTGVFTVIINHSLLYKMLSDRRQHPIQRLTRTHGPIAFLHTPNFINRSMWNQAVRKRGEASVVRVASYTINLP